MRMKRLNINKVEQFIEEADGDPILLDVRTPAEYAHGHLPGALNLSHELIPQATRQYDEDQPLILYCRSGARSTDATRFLMAQGFTRVYEAGGIIDYKGPVVR